MSKTEKRELIEQQRKIFEAGAQRVDRRTGSFSFLTWSFFLAPLIAVEAFLSSTFGSAAGEEEDAKAVQAGATSHVMNNDPAAIDLFNAKAVDETTKEAATPLQAHADQAGGAELLAGPLEDAAEPNSEATAATRSGGRNDDSQLQGAHDLIHGSSVNALADSQLPASSAPASAQANALAGTPSHDVGRRGCAGRGCGAAGTCDGNRHGGHDRAMRWPPRLRRSRLWCSRCSRRQPTRWARRAMTWPPRLRRSRLWCSRCLRRQPTRWAH